MKHTDIRDDLYCTLRRLRDKDIDIDEALELLIVDISDQLEDIFDILHKSGRVVNNE